MRTDRFTLEIAPGVQTVITISEEQAKVSEQARRALEGLLECALSGATAVFSIAGFTADAAVLSHESIET